MIDLELDSKEEEATTHRPSSSIEMKLSLPKDPPSVETALKTLSTAPKFLTILEVFSVHKKQLGVCPETG